MRSATTVACKVVSSPTLIGPLALALKFKPVLWVVSHVTKTSLVVKETRAQA